jgi:hypothetical protein
MSDVTQILSQVESGDAGAAEQLLPLVYEELRKLAAAKLVQERPGQTLQATSPVPRSCCDTTLAGKPLAIALMRTNAGKPTFWCSAMLGTQLLRKHAG